MGLLDEILKQIEEAQREAEGRPPAPRPRSAPRPERESDEDGAEWEEDEAARPSHAPHIPSRRLPEPVAVVAEPAPARTTLDSRPAQSPHQRGKASSLHLRAMLADRPSLREALVLREILGPPPGLRHFKRPGR
jgi:hypothetical protein